MKWNEKENIPNWMGEAQLNVYDEVETVPVAKAVYSFDIFTLTVELGSALGLWLGKFTLYLKQKQLGSNIEGGYKQ